MKRRTIILLVLVLALTASIPVSGCAPAKSGGIELAETYLNDLISGDYEAAYELLSDYDKGNISQETYLEWKKQVARIIKINSAAVDSKVDRFKDYTYQGTKIGYALGLKIARGQEVLIPDIELDSYNQETYRQMVVYENGQWKMLLLLTDLENQVAAYQALLDQYDKK